MVEADGISVGELDGDSETDSDVRSLGEAVAVDSAECDDDFFVRISEFHEAQLDSYWIVTLSMRLPMQAASPHS